MLNFDVKTVMLQPKYLLTITQSQIKLNNAPYVVKKLFVGAEAKLCGKSGTE